MLCASDLRRCLFNDEIEIHETQYGLNGPYLHKSSLLLEPLHDARWGLWMEHGDPLVYHKKVPCHLV